MTNPRAALRAATTNMVGSIALPLLCLISSFANPALAQNQPHRLQARILESANASVRATLTGSRPALALAAHDTGRLAGDRRIEGVSILFSRSPAQESDLQTLIAAQQNPASPSFQKWLTPDQFAARFGIADSDLAQVQTWLQQQGFSVGEISRGRNRIAFSGTVAQIEAAFGTQIHTFESSASGAVETHFAPATDLTIPAAFAPVVAAVGNLSNFRPRSHARLMPPAVSGVQSHFNSGTSQNHFVAPQDVATIYDINPAYNAGYTGAGQSIAVVGQSAIVPQDIANFQTAAGTPIRPAVLNLVPGTGTSTLVSGDEVESDLDVEYTGAIARGATIYFVYTGSNTNYGAFDALQYAVTNRIAPIVSVSYGLCETALGAANYAAVSPMLAQAAAQGQSVIAAAGDAGSTDCFPETTLTAAQQSALAVDFPGDSQYVTAMGGSEYLAADVATGASPYWTAPSNTDTLSSALSYIPEMVWNDDGATALGSGGGGISVFTARPSWQTGVPGIPAGAQRLTPDIALASSGRNAGYLYCSSDAKGTGVTGGCTTGFRAPDNSLLVAGGTSFAAPIFSGMLAIINQKIGSVGQGVINPTLYTLAANPATYASAFHDITSGSNGCTLGATDCTSTTAGQYPATTGYDLATGIGTVDFFHLMTAWPNLSTKAGSSTTLTAATLSPAVGTADLVTITVAPGTGTTTPTGTITLQVDGVAVAPLTLAKGTATYSYIAPAVGQHVLVATYSGDANYSASSSTLVLSATLTGKFTVSAPAVSVTAGNSVTSSVTVTPTGGYTGTVAFTVTTSTPITYACYSISNAVVAGTAPATASLTIYTGSLSCSNLTTLAVGGVTVGSFSKPGTSASNTPPSRPNHSPAPLGVALAGLLTVGFLGRRSRRLRGLIAVACLAVAGFGLSGCGSGGTASTPGSSANGLSAAKGTYTVTVTGTDTTSATSTSTSTFTLTIQ